MGQYLTTLGCSPAPLWVLRLNTQTNLVQDLLDLMLYYSSYIHPIIIPKANQSHHIVFTVIHMWCVVCIGRYRDHSTEMAVHADKRRWRAGDGVPVIKPTFVWRVENQNTISGEYLYPLDIGVLGIVILKRHCRLPQHSIYYRNLYIDTGNGRLHMNRQINIRHSVFYFRVMNMRKYSK